MPFANRRTVHLENDLVRLSFLPGGGHIAAVTLRSNGVNPLWNPIWETIDPSGYDAAKHPEYGGGSEPKLLSGIVGHNLCFDLFGVPSEEELAGGLPVHGDASIADWEFESHPGELGAWARFPYCQMNFERRMRLNPGSQVVVITETAENLLGIDRPVGWTQHVTIGPPFLEKGKTIFHAPATHSKVYEGDFAPGGQDRFQRGAEFRWPMGPLTGGGTADMRLTVNTPVGGALTTHLMDPAGAQGFFTAFHPDQKTSFGYIWKRSDFPWLCIWEENYSRTYKPWNGKSLTRGMEFGASPFPETRKEMLARNGLFGERGYRWVPARAKVTVEYCLFIAETGEALETVVWKDGKVRGSGGFELAV